MKQLPGHRPGIRPGRKVLIRVDGAGATHAYLDWLTGQRLSYSVGFGLPVNTDDILDLIPDHVWTPAYDAPTHEGIVQLRDGAWVAEFPGLLDLSGWPGGMGVIARKERPHPGAQLRLTDHDGMRVTAFATNTRTGGPGTQPPTWSCGIVALAAEITAWMQMLALHGHDARRWEPKRLRLRLFTTPATLARRSRQTLLHLATKSLWAGLVADAVHRLRTLAVPG